MAFWKTFQGNPNRYPEKPLSPHFVLGRAAHALLLGDEVFDDKYVYVPDDAPKKPTKTQIAAFMRDGQWSDACGDAAIWWEEFTAKSQGKIEVTAEQVKIIQYMSENLQNNPLCVELLTSNLVELSMIWQDEETGIWLKSRPDCIPNSMADYSDLKTFSPKGPDIVLSAQRSITDHGYVFQMALGQMGSEVLLGHNAPECALVFTQVTEPYDCVPIIIDHDTLYWGKVLIRDALTKIKHGFETNDWPGAAIDVVRYAFPPSMAQRISDQQAAGMLPSV